MCVPGLNCVFVLTNIDSVFVLTNIDSSNDSSRQVKKNRNTNWNIVPVPLHNAQVCSGNGRMFCSSVTVPRNEVQHHRVSVSKRMDTVSQDMDTECQFRDNSASE